MELITPAVGLVFWTTLVFVILLVVLRGKAWKPVLSAVKERESKIEDALELAEKTKIEMAQLKHSNEQMLKEAREERDAMLKDARDTRNKIVDEAKGKAKNEAGKIIADAQLAINNQKNAAIAELKNQVATLSIDIAEKVIKTELSSNDKQKALATNLVAELNMN